jgi:hypothetical protein
MALLRFARWEVLKVLPLRSAVPKNRERRGALSRTEGLGGEGRQSAIIIVSVGPRVKCNLCLTPIRRLLYSLVALRKLTGVRKE